MDNNLLGLKKILKDGKKELMEINELRENAQKSMRKTLRFSKQAILSIHQKKIPESNNLVGKAKENISKLQLIAKNHPEIIYTGMYSAALQEYSEANILLGLIQEKKFITPRELNVPYSEYILGLADVIGEYRRLTLDSLREDFAEKGEKYLKKMEEIYLEILAMDEAYMLVPGLRRKCDVARKIIEITRGDVTQEVRRKSLEKCLREVEKGQKKPE
jgi:translin